MLLADREIREAIESGEIRIDPFEPANVQPASVDVRLGREFQMLTPGPEPIDPRTDSAGYFRHVVIHNGGVAVLMPGEFVLASTFERVTLPDVYVARVEGKSSLARIGLQVHATAGFIDPCFDGTVTLEISNLTPRAVLLYPGMKIGQLAFERMTGPADSPYGTAAIGSRYQGQSGPTCSRIHIGFTHGLPAVEQQEAAA